MALSWSMDKIGPIARSAEDCAMVFNAIRGPDGLDQTVVDLPFNYTPDIDLSTFRIGYLTSASEQDTLNRKQNQAVLKTLQNLGAQRIPVEIPRLPGYPLALILTAEAAAAFDELTRSNRDTLLVRQIRNAWPNVFRAARFIPAVEYLQANRVRYRLIQEMRKVFQTVDVYATPSFGPNLLLTNLNGHPCVAVPNGFDATGHPTSVSFIGDVYDEATVPAVAKKFQDATDFHKKHPPLFYAEKQSLSVDRAQPGQPMGCGTIPTPVSARATFRSNHRLPIKPRFGDASLSIPAAITIAAYRRHRDNVFINQDNCYCLSRPIRLYFQ